MCVHVCLHLAAPGEAAITGTSGLEGRMNKALCIYELETIFQSAFWFPGHSHTRSGSVSAVWTLGEVKVWSAKTPHLV